MPKSSAAKKPATATRYVGFCAMCESDFKLTTNAEPTGERTTMAFLSYFQFVEPVRLMDLFRLNTGEMRALPTLSSGQFDNLKFDNGVYRLWDSRMTVRDFDGDHDAYVKQRFVIERLEGCVWTRVCCACPDARCSAEKQAALRDESKREALAAAEQDRDLDV